MPKMLGNPTHCPDNQISADFVCTQSEQTNLMGRISRNLLPRKWFKILKINIWNDEFTDDQIIQADDVFANRGTER